MINNPASLNEVTFKTRKQTKCSEGLRNLVTTLSCQEEEEDCSDVESLIEIGSLVSTSSENLAASKMFYLLLGKLLLGQLHLKVSNKYLAPEVWSSPLKL